MKIVLGDPPNINGKMKNEGNLGAPNLAILYLISYLRSKMSDLQLFYLRGDIDLDLYLKKLEEIKPDVFGISFASLFANISYQTINAIKDKFPNLPVITGGAHPTAYFNEVLSSSKADICIIGEGEQTMLELAEYFKSGKGSLSNIKGIAYKENGEIKRTSIRPHIQNLDSIPFPAWDLIDFKDYPGMSVAKGFPNTAVIFSRGCPFNCVFCSNPVWRASKPWLRLRSPENIAAEVEMLYKRGIREIWIRADQFNSVKDWTIAVAEKIKNLNHPDLFFECNIRANLVSEPVVKALKEMNVWMINLGLESFNQRVLDGIDKRTTVQQIYETCQLFKKYGIKIYAWLMFYNVWEKDGNLCCETPEEVENTLKMAKKYYKEGLIGHMSWQVATAVPGSKLFDIAKKYDLIIETGKYNNPWEPSMQLPGITMRQIMRHRMKGMLLQSYTSWKSGFLSLKSPLIFQRILKKVGYILESMFNFK